MPTAFTHTQKHTHTHTPSSETVCCTTCKHPLDTTKENEKEERNDIFPTECATTLHPSFLVVLPPLSGSTHHYKHMHVLITPSNKTELGRYGFYQRKFHEYRQSVVAGRRKEEREREREKERERR